MHFCIAKEEIFQIIVGNFKVMTIEESRHDDVRFFLHMDFLTDMVYNQCFIGLLPLLINIVGYYIFQTYAGVSIS